MDAALNGHWFYLLNMTKWGMTHHWSKRSGGPATPQHFLFFSSQDNLLFMYQLPIKRRCCWERHSSLFVLLCVHAELEKWKNDDNSLYQENSQDQFMNYFLLLIPRYLLVWFCFFFSLFCPCWLTRAFNQSSWLGYNYNSLQSYH